MEDLTKIADEMYRLVILDREDDPGELGYIVNPMRKWGRAYASEFLLMLDGYTDENFKYWLERWKKVPIGSHHGNFVGDTGVYA